AEVTDRNADLADFAAAERMVGVIPGLGRQIEGDRKAGLAFGEVFPVERVRLSSRRMPRIGADDPWLVGLLRRTIQGPDHGCVQGLAIVQCNTIASVDASGIYPANRPGRSPTPSLPHTER